jgi:hypothetical protein
MTAPSSSDLLWGEHTERMHPLSGAIPTQDSLMVGGDSHEDGSGEWTAAPPGRLGRHPLADNEPYLEFFAIAGS